MNLVTYKGVNNSVQDDHVFYGWIMCFIGGSFVLWVDLVFCSLSCTQCMT